MFNTRSNIISSDGSVNVVYDRVDYTYDLSVLADESKVLTVFGRTGHIVASSGDYRFDQLADRPTTIVGYGITDALNTSESYSDPAWITSLSKSKVGLSNVDNTSDAAKPLSTASIAALAGKEDVSNKSTDVNLGSSDSLYPTQNAVKTYVDSNITGGSVPSSRTINGYPLTDDVDLVPSDLGLGNVNNTSDANKPISTLTQAALDVKLNTTTFNSHTANTSNPHSVTKAQVGLSAVDNTSDVNKPVSTATQTALNLKANLVSPALTGTPTAPTATAGANTTQIATTAFVTNAVADSTAGVSSFIGRTGAVVAATNDYTWAQINKTTSSLADITTKNASDLTEDSSHRFVTDTEKALWNTGGIKDIINITIEDLRDAADPSVTSNYYITDEGKQGIWYYDADDTTSADNLGTILVNTATNRRYKRADSSYINVRWFGGVPDFVPGSSGGAVSVFLGTGTDNTAAATAAIAAAKNGQRIIFDGTGTWYFEDDVVIDNSSDITKKYNVTFEGNAVFDIGHGFIIQGTYNTFEVIGGIYSKNMGSGEDYVDYEGTGVYMRNLYNSTVITNVIQGFKVGAMFGADSSFTAGSAIGNQYNSFHYKKIFQCDIQIQFATFGTADSLGNWVNENTIWGGQLGGGTTGAGGNYGIYMVKGDATQQFKYEGHKFYNTGCEGLVNGIYMEYAQNNDFFAGRFEEGAVTNKIYLETDSGITAYNNRFHGWTLKEQHFVKGGVCTVLDGCKVYSDGGVILGEGISLSTGTDGKFLNFVGRMPASGGWNEAVNDVIAFSGHTVPLRTFSRSKINGTERFLEYNRVYQNMTASGALTQGVTHLRLSTSAGEVVATILPAELLDGTHIYVEVTNLSNPFSIVRSDNAAVILSTTGITSTGRWIISYVNTNGVFRADKLGNVTVDTSITDGSSNPVTNNAIYDALILKANLAAPTFTGTVVLPSTTSIGSVSSTELSYLDGVTSAIQTQLGTKSPLTSPTFTGTVVLPSTTSIGSVTNTELAYLSGLTSNIQDQIDGISGGGGAWGDITGTLSDQTDLQSALDLKATLASPTFTGTVVLPSTTSIGSVSNTEIGYLDGVTDDIQDQLDDRPTFSQTIQTTYITSNVSTTSTSWANITGLSFPVVSGGHYYFKFYIMYNSAATTTGAKFAIQGSATGGTVLRYRVECTDTSLSWNRLFQEGMNGFDDGDIAFSTQSLTNNNMAIVEGVYNAGSNGTCIARFASEVGGSQINVMGNSSHVQWLRLNP